MFTFIFIAKVIYTILQSIMWIHGFVSFNQFSILCVEEYNEEIGHSLWWRGFINYIIGMAISVGVVYWLWS